MLTAVAICQKSKSILDQRVTDAPWAWGVHRQKSLLFMQCFGTSFCLFLDIQAITQKNKAIMVSVPTVKTKQKY